MRSRGFLIVMVFIAAVGVVLLWQSKPAGEEELEKESPLEKKTPLTKGVQAVDRAKVLAAQANLKSIQLEVLSYISEYGRTPENLEPILQSAHLESGDKDIWGTPVRYVRISDESFQLISAGSDRKFDTRDDIVLKY